MNMVEYVCPLESHHDRSSFDCGSEPLNTYIKFYATQNNRTGAAQTHVLIRHNQVIAFYSLAIQTIDKHLFPSRLAKKFPNYPLGVLVLARFGVDSRYKGQGIGGALLGLALESCYRSLVSIGGVAVIVDAKDETAKQFYEHFGFKSFPSQPLKLYMSRDELIVQFNTPTPPTLS